MNLAYRPTLPPPPPHPGRCKDGEGQGFQVDLYLPLSFTLPFALPFGIRELTSSTQSYLHRSAGDWGIQIKSLPRFLLPCPTYHSRAESFAAMQRVREDDSVIVGQGCQEPPRNCMPRLTPPPPCPCQRVSENRSAT